MSEELLNETTEQPVITESSESPTEEIDTPPAEPEWQPNYKFSVMNKEYEFPEYIRPAITKENYSEVLDTYTKAYGLEHAKSRAERLESELSSIKPQYETQSRAMGYLGKLVKDKDIATLARELKIPDETIISYAYERAKVSQMEPHEREQYEQRYAEKQRLHQAETELSYRKQQDNLMEVQARISEIKETVSSGPMRDFVAEYETRAGDGAFLQQVAKEGYLRQQQGEIISTQRAIEAALKTIGYSNMQPPQNGSPNTASYGYGQPTVSRATSVPKPVIPNVRGNSSVGTGQRPKSLAELKEIAYKYRE